jgi:hypothetical protein
MPRKAEIAPHARWIDDWRVGIAPAREGEIGRALLRVFTSFWNHESLVRKSTTTQRRYSAGLHVLGNYLVERAVDDEGLGKTSRELLDEVLNSQEGPLVHYDNELWQRELDTVCRRLFTFLTKS